MLMRLFAYRSSLLGLLLLGAVGCTASPAARVELTGDAGRKLIQSFDRAAFKQSPTGEYDIILVDQTAADSRTSRQPSRALDPATASPLTHILHIRVLWRPTRTIRGESPTATNASIQWTVLGQGAGRIDYTGAGFAQVYGEPDQIRVTLRNIHITPNTRRGDLTDPIGAATVFAKFKARRDASFVGSALATIRATGETASNPTGVINPALGYDRPPGRPVSP